MKRDSRSMSTTSETSVTVDLGIKRTVEKRKRGMDDPESG